MKEQILHKIAITLFRNGSYHISVIDAYKDLVNSHGSEYFLLTELYGLNSKERKFLFEQEFV